MQVPEVFKCMAKLFWSKPLGITIPWHNWREAVGMARGSPERSIICLLDNRRKRTCTSVHRFAVSLYALDDHWHIRHVKSICYVLVWFGTKGARIASADISARHRQRRPEASQDIETGLSSIRRK